SSERSNRTDVVFKAPPRCSCRAVFRTDWICHAAQAGAFDKCRCRWARKGVQLIEAAECCSHREFALRIACSIESDLQAHPPARRGEEKESLRLLRGRRGIGRLLSCGCR